MFLFVAVVPHNYSEITCVREALSTHIVHFWFAGGRLFSLVFCVQPDKIGASIHRLGCVVLCQYSKVKDEGTPSELRHAQVRQCMGNEYGWHRIHT